MARWAKGCSIALFLSITLSIATPFACNVVLRHTRSEPWYEEAQDGTIPVFARDTRPHLIRVGPATKNGAIQMLDESPIIALSSAETFSLVGPAPLGTEGMSAYLIRAVKAEDPVDLRISDTGRTIEARTFDRLCLLRYPRLERAPVVLWSNVKPETLTMSVYCEGP